MAASSSEFVIPVEWVDDCEFQAMEDAIAVATSAYKRLKTSTSSHPSTSDDRNANSAGRRLPGWAVDKENNVSSTSKPSNNNNIYYESRVSANNVNEGFWPAQGHGFESQQTPSFWAYVRGNFRAAPKPVVPKINFGGHIVYSKTPFEVEKASMELLQILKSRKSNKEVPVPMGLDLEWKPFYNRVGEKPTKVAVVQICLGSERCDVMHIIHSGIPPVLQSLLEDQSSVKVGVCIGGDALKMKNDYNVHVRDYEDLSTLACQKLRPPRRWSLSTLCEKLTGKEVDKPRHIRCGNWEVDNLSIAQLQYAATDAYASWYLYEALKSLPDLPVGNSNEGGNC